MRDGLTDSNDLSPMKRGGIGSMAVLLSAMVSIVAGVIFPTTGMSLEPYILVWLGGLLYVNLINLHPRHLVSTFRKPKTLVVFTIGKLILLPCIVYVITSLVYPKLALSATLLSGISTGLGAPFAINFIGAGGISTIAALVTISSLVVPATLPFIIYVFFEDTEEFVIPIYDISFLLVTALFIPLSLGWSTRRYVPRISKFVAGNSLFLSVIYLIVGYLLALSIKEQLIATRINGIIAMTYINNILVFVIAERFFNIETAALAAFYNIPYYAGLLILRVKYSRRRNQESK